MKTTNAERRGVIILALVLLLSLAGLLIYDRCAGTAEHAPLPLPVEDSDASEESTARMDSAAAAREAKRFEKEMKRYAPRPAYRRSPHDFEVPASDRPR